MRRLSAARRPAARSGRARRDRPDERLSRAVQRPGLQPRRTEVPLRPAGRRRRHGRCLRSGDGRQDLLLARRDHLGRRERASCCDGARTRHRSGSLSRRRFDSGGLDGRRRALAPRRSLAERPVRRPRASDEGPAPNGRDDREHARERVAHRLDLRGDFEVETVSRDGKRLFLIQHLAGKGAPRYLVRLFDLSRDRLASKPLRRRRRAERHGRARLERRRVARRPLAAHALPEHRSQRCVRPRRSTSYGARRSASSFLPTAPSARSSATG